MATVAVATLCAVLLWTALTAAPAAAADCKGANARPGKISTGQAERAVICLVNRLRAKQGRKGPRPSAQLRKMARSHTRGMIARRRIDHTGFAKRARRYQRGCKRALLVENVGQARTPRGIVDSWSRSRIHRGNLVERGLRQVGVGAVRRGGTFVFTFDSGFCRR